MEIGDEPTQSPKREIILSELRKETGERLSRIDREFADGFDLINKYNDTVTFFGSARFTSDNPYYRKDEEVARALSAEGYTIVSGGGGGIMEAADKGASEVGGNAIGLNIQLPNEQQLNPYATESMAFRYFFIRKVILVFGASAYIFFPGGFGTLDEFFEVITLIQTKKMPLAPVICYGSEYWTAVDRLIKAYLLEGMHTISPGDETIYSITEDVEVIKAIINHHRDTANAFTPPPNDPPVL
ncbi:MAG TPA: TIGR00730 family Rossman fold protein [Verrucomicrobiae bacterium]|nr:TIGR00730 family Rossman fold protein [Verrucomicrobiae bacterium]